MKLSIRIEGADTLAVKLRGMRDRLIDRRVMGRAALAAEQMVKEHTERGEDQEGTHFVPYSPGHFTYKQKRGGRYFTGGVNLHDGGHMLASVHGRAESKTRGVVAFSKAREAVKASGHQFGSKILPKRPFFGLQNREKQQIRELIRANLRAIGFKDA